MAVLGLYDSGECGIFAFLVNLENGCCMWVYSDLGNYDGVGSDENFKNIVSLIKEICN